VPARGGLELVETLTVRRSLSRYLEGLRDSGAGAGGGGRRGDV